MIPSLPLPLVSALVLAFLLVILLLRRGPPGFFVALVGLCAVQAAIIALAQHYGIAAFRFLQPVTAAAIPPLAWVAFQFSAVRRSRLPHDLAHLAGPVLVAAALLVMPALLDALIPALFLGYGGTILLAVWRGADGLPRLPIEVGDTPGLVWKVIALSLIVSALGDGLIAVAVMGGQADWSPWIVAIDPRSRCSQSAAWSWCGASDGANATRSRRNPPSPTTRRRTRISRRGWMRSWKAEGSISIPN